MLDSIIGNEENTNTIINDIKELRMLLHSTLYANEDKIQELMNLIQSNLSLFYINYDPIRRVIQFKIKKTALKPNVNESLKDYYYHILDDIFITYFINNLNLLKGVNTNNANLDYLVHPMTISTLYNIVMLSDNIISIYI